MKDRAYSVVANGVEVAWTSSGADATVQTIMNDLNGVGLYPIMNDYPDRLDAYLAGRLEAIARGLLKRNPRILLEAIGEVERDAVQAFVTRHYPGSDLVEPVQQIAFIVGQYEDTLKALRRGAGLEPFATPADAQAWVGGTVRTGWRSRKVWRLVDVKGHVGCISSETGRVAQIPIRHLIRVTPPVRATDRPGEGT